MTRTPNWQIITLGLHRMGGGPLPRKAFDGDLETNNASRVGIARAKTLGLASMTGHGPSTLWTLTPRWHDWHAGRALFVAGGWRYPADLAAERKRRVDRLIADSDEAAEACAKLTARQTEVLTLLAKGFTHDETSAMLGLRPGSIDSHVMRLLRAIGCDRTIEAVVIAAKAGVV